jgi:hypothetical protein
MILKLIFKTKIKKEGLKAPKREVTGRKILPNCILGVSTFARRRRNNIPKMQLARILNPN